MTGVSLGHRQVADPSRPAGAARRSSRTGWSCSVADRTTATPTRPAARRGAARWRPARGRARRRRSASSPSCPECAELHADLLALSAAPAGCRPAPRPRDFRLTAADADASPRGPREPAGSKRPSGGCDDRPTTDDHATPRHLLVASLADHFARTDRAIGAEALVAACDDCADLHADLLALRDATRAMPTPPRPRDYALTPADAARLRRGGWRRFVAAFGSPRDVFSRPLAVGPDDARSGRAEECRKHPELRECWGAFDRGHQRRLGLIEDRTERGRHERREWHGRRRSAGTRRARGVGGGIGCGGSRCSIGGLRHRPIGRRRASCFGGPARATCDQRERQGPGRLCRVTVPGRHHDLRRPGRR